MGVKSPLRVGYLLMVVQGLLSVVVPKTAIKLANVGWLACFENVEELEPRDWYVEVTRVVGVGLLAAGFTGLLVTGAEKRERERASEEQAAADAASDDGGDGPVTVDVEGK